MSNSLSLERERKQDYFLHAGHAKLLLNTAMKLYGKILDVFTTR